ncbi:MAG: hypothetical protein MJA30_27510 [Cytophagales bacterium]|nr:hypothetical protein [Cytophagales bacterium]
MQNPYIETSFLLSNIVILAGLTHRSPYEASRNDDKEGFFVSDEGISRVPLFLMTVYQIIECEKVTPG